MGLSRRQQYPEYEGKTTHLKTEPFIPFGADRRKHGWNTLGKGWLLRRLSPFICGSKFFSEVTGV